MVRVLVWLLAACLLGAPLRAQTLDLPGIAADAQAYAAGLARRAPAGATPQARQESQNEAYRAAEEQRFGDAAAAWEKRAGQGGVNAQVWRNLADAQLRKTPPDAKAAVAAAWLEYAASRPEGGRVPALLHLADTLVRADNAEAALRTLQFAAGQAPGNDEVKTRLASAQAGFAVVVRRIAPVADATPPRACIEFVLPPRAGNLAPQDWVRTEPALPGLAVTREDGRFCMIGLPAGATTRVILRAGLPGEGGRALAADLALDVAMPNLAPRIGFDGRLFVLPRGQARSVSLSTVNLSAVRLRLVRLSERNTAGLLRDAPLGAGVEFWRARFLADELGRTVWEGRAEIPAWTRNTVARTALPLPEALAQAGPGLYLLIADQGDGTRDFEGGAVQPILRTDLAPTVWRGSDGLVLQLRGYDDARVRAGARLVLLARNNDILGETTTDAEGVARFAAPLLAGGGPVAPASIQAFAGDDFATLDLNAPAFDLSDRGVEGLAHPGRHDAYVWLDRGIYRPGETVQAMALLRDAAGRPVDLPARLTVRRPNGQVFLQATPARLAEAALHLPIPLSAGAAAGTWSIDVQIDPQAPPIGHAEFRVEAFVPDRLAVEAEATPAFLVPGQAAALPVVARFLYGAPGAELSAHASVHLIADPAPFAGAEGEGFRFGLADESVTADDQEVALPRTDAQGRTSFAYTPAGLPDVTHPLRAEIAIGVDDPAGRASRTRLSLPIRPVGPSIGIRPGFAGGAVNEGEEASFAVIALAPDGGRAALAAKLRLVREVASWNMVARGQFAHYEIAWRDEVLESAEVAIPADGLKLARRLGFGRYRLEISQAGGLAASSVRFRVGWGGGGNPDIPDAVDVSSATPVVAVGGVARVHIAPPFAGQASVAVLSDRVLSLREVTVPAGGMDIEVPVTDAWGPGAYVAVQLYRAAGQRPARAIGLAWIGVDPAARTLAMTIETPARAAPRAGLVVPVRAAPGAWVSLAAVDEGILRLTRFASPDPRPHFLGRRRLGLDIRDDWGRLIAPAEGTAALLREGGDDGPAYKPDTPLRTVTLFAPPVQAGADGIARFALDIPDFNGEVRLMAVGWQGSRIGAASQAVTIRDPLVAELLLPRFLAPGDEARLGVLLHAIDVPDGRAEVSLSAGGALALAGPARLAVELRQGVLALPASALRAVGAGVGTVGLEVSFPGGLHLARSETLQVRPARAAVTLVSGGELAPGGQVRLDPGAERFVPGTLRATASFGAPVRYDAAAMVRALADYPWNCLEQIVSRALPLSVLADGAMAGPDRAGRLFAAVAAVLDHQRYDGGFALWSAAGPADGWMSAYAVDFLLRARAAGAAVPAAGLAEGLKFLAGQVAEAGDSAEERAVEAYALYVLARAGQGQPGAARIRAEDLAAAPTPLARAQIAAALALAHDAPRAEAAFGAALAAPGRRWWSFDAGTALRDQLAIAVLLRESGLLPAALAKLRGALPGADLRPEALSTQEQAWAATAAAVLGRDGGPVRVALDGQARAGEVVSAAIDGVTVAKNLGERAVWQSLAASGVPVAASPAARAGMRIARQFVGAGGEKLDLDHLAQNTLFTLILDGRAEDGQAHRALVTAGLPAGWEIVARLPAGAQGGAAWLGTLSETEAQPAADDRYGAVVALSPEKPDIHLAVRLRAVTPGSFELPGAEVADMYRPGVFARQASGRIVVQPAP